MGCCMPCLNSSQDFTPDIDMRRQKMGEAALQRQNEAANRGIKDPASVKRKQEAQQKLEEEENKRARMGGGQGGEDNLRWSVD